MSGRFKIGACTTSVVMPVICSLRPALWIRPLRERDTHTAFTKIQPVRTGEREQRRCSHLSPRMTPLALSVYASTTPMGGRKRRWVDGASDKAAVAVREDRRWRDAARLVRTRRRRLRAIALIEWRKLLSPTGRG